MNKSEIEQLNNKKTTDNKRFGASGGVTSNNLMWEI